MLGIGDIAFELYAYPVSYIELIGTISGLASVYFASRANILTWPIGILNEVMFFLLFFQVRLYADMFLQVFFFITTLYGWYNWRKSAGHINTNIFELNKKNKFLLITLIGGTSVLCGILISKIHLMFPIIFTEAADFPFIDSFIMVSSIIATILLANKMLDNWYIWIIVDITCVFLYAHKGIYFLTLEYVVFLILSVSGLLSWKKNLSAIEKSIHIRKISSIS